MNDICGGYVFPFYFSFILSIFHSHITSGTAALAGSKRSVPFHFRVVRVGACVCLLLAGLIILRVANKSSVVNLTEHLFFTERLAFRECTAAG